MTCDSEVEVIVLCKMKAPESSEHEVVVTHFDHSTERGGAEFALRRLLSHPKRGWRAVLAVPADLSGNIGIYEELRDSDEVEIVQLSGGLSSQGKSSRLRLIYRSVRDTWRMAMEVRRVRALECSVVVDANTSRAGLILRIALLGRRRPKFVLHLRDRVDVSALGWLGKAAFAYFVLPRCDGVISNSESTLETAAPYLKRSCLRTVIPSPIGVSRRASAGTSEATVSRIYLEDSGHDVVVGMLARIADWKGQDLLIRAFARALSGSRAILKLAGGTDFGSEGMLADLKELARSCGVEAQVEFCGHVDDIWKFLDGVDICVQCSLRPEPLGQNVLQYLTAGKATIASDRGGPPEWITDMSNGVLFRQGDEEGLASALSLLAGDSDFRAKIASAARSQRNLPSDEAVCEMHSAFYAEVVSD